MQHTSEFQGSSQARASSKLAYRRSKPGEYETIIRVLGERQHPEYLAAKTQLFDWQFQQNPHQDGRSPFVVGATRESILGVSGVMPVRLRYRGRPMLAGWNVDLAVSQRARGHGCGTELLCRLSHEAEVMMSYGISDMADPLFARYGWESGSPVRVYFYSVRERGALGMLKNFRSRTARARRAEIDHSAPPNDLQLSCSSTMTFGPEVDALWSRSEAGYTKVVERNSAYLKWKYGQHPTLSYLSLTARRGGELKALLIVRYDPIESVIVDYCGPARAPGLIDPLVGRAVDELCARSTTRIRCETTDSCVASSLTKYGFSLWGSSRFRVWSNVVGDTDSGESWFLMTGDSDNDLLNGC